VAELKALSEGGAIPDDREIDGQVSALERRRSERENKEVA